MTDQRLEELGWGVFLLMTGILWLLPSDQVPPGTWLIGTGLLLLGMNLVRYVKGMVVSPFTTILGVLALAGGIAESTGITIPLLAIAIVIAGATLLVKPMLRMKGREPR